MDNIRLLALWTDWLRLTFGQASAIQHADHNTTTTIKNILNFILKSDQNTG